MQNNNEKEIDKSIGKEILDQIKELKEKIELQEEEIKEIKKAFQIQKDDGSLYEYCKELLEKKGYISTSILYNDEMINKRYTSTMGIWKLFKNFQRAYMKENNNLLTIKGGRGNAIYLCKSEDEEKVRAMILAKSKKKLKSRETIKFTIDYLNNLEWEKPQDLKEIMSILYPYRTSGEIWKIIDNVKRVPAFSDYFRIKTIDDYSNPIDIGNGITTYDPKLMVAKKETESYNVLFRDKKKR